MGSCRKPTLNCSVCRTAWLRRKSWLPWENWFQGRPTRSAIRSTLCENFAEVSVEMYEELTEVLGSYEDNMIEEDRTAIHDLEEDLADSLNRIRPNGGRAPIYSRTYEESGSDWRRIDAGGP